MATLSIRIPDRLKSDVSAEARRQGVSMNNYIACCLSAAVAQESAQRFFRDRLEGVEPGAVRAQFAAVMSRTQTGEPPSEAEIDAAANSDR
jgi:hypothetical protein